MEKTGTVVKKNGNIAEILIKRDSACGENCAACGLCSNNELRIKLAVSPEINEGDMVRLLTKDSLVVGFSAAGYLGLTAFLLLGALLGTVLGGEWFGFLLALIFVLCGALIIRKVSPRDAKIKVEKI